MVNPKWNYPLAQRRPRQYKNHPDRRPLGEKPTLRIRRSDKWTRLTTPVRRAVAMPTVCSRVQDPRRQGPAGPMDRRPHPNPPVIAVVLLLALVRSIVRAPSQPIIEYRYDRAVNLVGILSAPPYVMAISPRSFHLACFSPIPRRVTLAAAQNAGLDRLDERKGG